jgi:secretory phospholipase A2
MCSLALIFNLIWIFCLVDGKIDNSFLNDLDKMDIDSKLREIDKLISSIDNNEADVNFVPGSSKHKAGTSKPKAGTENEETLGSAVEMLAEMFGGDCKYTCKNGNKPVQEPGHTPSSNGCGSYGIKVDVDDVPGMEDCCHKHDYCYDTCNSERVKCDKKFKACLQETCKKAQSSKSKKVSDKDCRTAADLLYSASAALGCEPFLKAQEKACTCGKTKTFNANTKKQETKKAKRSVNDEL